jgi:hypothetical protein
LPQRQTVAFAKKFKMAAAIERRSTMNDFTTISTLGSGSYGKVFKVQRKVDNQL